LTGTPCRLMEERLNIVNAVIPAAEFDTVVRAWAHKVAAKSPLLM
jgi:enoyl-CoA hydratase